MADLWSRVAELDAGMQDRLADVLETRGAQPVQRQLRRALLSQIPFPRGARVVEVGCGTGVLTRVLATWPGVGEVLGLDLAPSLIERARQLAADLPGVRFEQADATALPLADEEVDVVVLDSTLSHLPEPGRALAEAARILRPGGVCAILDGDYATATVALSDHDPLQACVEAMMAGSVTDRFVVRRLAALASSAGLEDLRLTSHGYVESDDATYILTVVDRGADLLAAEGVIGGGLASALKDEARERARAGRFFGHIAYASLVGRRPGG